MDIKRITSQEELQQLSDSWNCLSRGVPFRSWQWLTNWYEHYGQQGELFTLAVSDGHGTLVGLAPWYLESSTAGGRVLKFLGSGDVCSDYMSILATEEYEDAVSEQLAKWLTAANQESDSTDRWDLLHLTGVATSDRMTAKLIANLVEEGASVHRNSGPNCWRIPLPESWEEYVASLSKSHRKQVRRVERRMLDSGRAVLKTARSQQEVDHGMQILTELHQKRRRALGQPGCFACEQFSGFLNSAAADLYQADRLRLHWIECEGQPIAAEFHLTGGEVTYAYQAGVDPDRMEDEPGRLINIATLKKAIEEGYRGFDFLRGDEPYKAHWRAERRPSLDLRIVPQRTSAQIRHGVWAAGSAMKTFFRGTLNLTGMN